MSTDTVFSVGTHDCPRSQRKTVRSMDVPCFVSDQLRQATARGLRPKFPFISKEWYQIVAPNLGPRENRLNFFP